MALEKDCLTSRKEWPNLSAVLLPTTILALVHTAPLLILVTMMEMYIVELEGSAT